VQFRGCCSHGCAAFVGLAAEAIGFGPSGRCCLANTIDFPVSEFTPKSGLWREWQVLHATCSIVFASWLTSGIFGRQTMQKGTVKWFNPTKGYGFIKPSTGDKDVFVHISAVERAGLRTLNEGQEVEYELVTNRGRTSAENLKVA
jgi:cold shock protein